MYDVSTLLTTLLTFCAKRKVGGGENAINYSVFTHSYMYMLLDFLVTTFLGAILLYGHMSPNRYVLITKKLCSQSTYIGKKKNIIQKCLFAIAYKPCIYLA